MKTGDLQIPTSYGHLSAKTWGTDGEDRLRVLAVHGWQDNAGTFNRLFPLLDHLNRLYIVALDLPGHGRSSHLPKGVPYTDMTWVIELKRTIDYLGWNGLSSSSASSSASSFLNQPQTPKLPFPKKGVIIIAHSMGANAAVELAALYPHLVHTLIMLDTVKLRVFPTENLAAEMGRAIEVFSNHEKNTAFRTTKPILFDLERALSVIIETHGNGKLTKDAAVCLMERAMQWTGRQAGGDGKRGFAFLRDPRLICPVYRKFDAPQLLNYLSSIRCRLLIVRARDTHPMLRCPHEDQFVEMYREHCEEFAFQAVDGDHYVHLTEAAKVAPYVNAFLRQLFD